MRDRGRIFCRRGFRRHTPVTSTLRLGGGGETLSILGWGGYKSTAELRRSLGQPKACRRPTAHAVSSLSCPSASSACSSSSSSYAPPLPLPVPPLLLPAAKPTEDLWVADPFNRGKLFVGVARAPTRGATPESSETSTGFIGRPLGGRTLSRHAEHHRCQPFVGVASAPTRGATPESSDTSRRSSLESHVRRHGKRHRRAATPADDFLVDTSAAARGAATQSITEACVC